MCVCKCNIIRQPKESCYVVLTCRSAPLPKNFMLQEKESSSKTPIQFKTHHFHRSTLYQQLVYISLLSYECLVPDLSHYLWSEYSYAWLVVHILKILFVKIFTRLLFLPFNFKIFLLHRIFENHVVLSCHWPSQIFKICHIFRNIYFLYPCFNFPKIMLTAHKHTLAFPSIFVDWFSSWRLMWLLQFFS
jgi:hypothetical protein